MKNNTAIYVNVPRDYEADTVSKVPFHNVQVLDDELVVDGHTEKIPGELEGKVLNYCELTVQYWAWRNTAHDYYGFCKNNKLFSFSEDRFEGNPQNWIWFYYLNDATAQKLSMDEQTVERKLCAKDFWVTEPYTVPYANVKEYYTGDEFPLHRGSDLQAVYDALGTVHPDDLAYADKFLAGKSIYPDNMFAASKEAFGRYCKWLFPILFEAEKHIDLSHRSREALAALRDLAVYLLGVYYVKISSGGELSAGELQRAFIERDQKTVELKPAFGDQGDAILIASSDYYVPYCAVTIQSIIEHADESANYDFVIFQQDMTKEHMSVLRGLAAGRKNVSVRFCDPRAFIGDSNRFQKIALDFNVTRFPPILAYRAFAPFILKNFRRFVWLDCDLVFEHDISELFKFDMRGKVVAFVNDIVICGYANGSDKTTGTYYTDAFIMNDIYQYGNAGVVMFDIAAFLREVTFDHLLEKSIEYKHIIPEQDTINSTLEGKSIFLDKRWNLVAFGPGPEWIQRFVPKDAYDEYLAAKEDPYVVHYVGPCKPWDNAGVPMSEHFWKYARRTPYYEVILQRLVEGLGKPPAPDPNRSPIRKTADVILPPGSARRRIVKKIMPKKGSAGWHRMKKIYYSFFHREK